MLVAVDVIHLVVATVHGHRMVGQCHNPMMHVSIAIGPGAQAGRKAFSRYQGVEFLGNGDRDAQVTAPAYRGDAGELQTIDAANEDKAVAVDDDDLGLDHRQDDGVARFSALGGPAADG